MTPNPMPTPSYALVNFGVIDSDELSEELVALLLFIISGDLSISQVSSLFMPPPPTRYFPLMVSHGISPGFKDMPGYLLDQPIEESNGNPFKVIKGYLSLKKMYAIFDWPNSLDSWSTKPMDWHWKDMPQKTRKSIWTCPSALLQKNLQGIINEWFDCESTV
ncbi:hypothetical protein [Candidatus Sororendozoicomonas aggregata]|uniref:hypothetical protein n=1 Tax=Candidatus Sororendozoicomonas aggregata TaxID=3073239 RepID=UPI002ED56691